MKSTGIRWGLLITAAVAIVATVVVTWVVAVPLGPLMCPAVLPPPANCSAPSRAVTAAAVTAVVVIVYLLTTLLAVLRPALRAPARIGVAILLASIPISYAVVAFVPFVAVREMDAPVLVLPQQTLSSPVTGSIDIAVVDMYRGLPEGSAFGEGVDFTVARITAEAEDATLWAVSTWGSSSCPRVPEAVEIHADGSIGIRTVETTPDAVPGVTSVCTADLAATTTIVEAPEGYTTGNIEAIDGVPSLIIIDPSFRP